MRNWSNEVILPYSTTLWEADIRGSTQLAKSAEGLTKQFEGLKRAGSNRLFVADVHGRHVRGYRTRISNEDASGGVTIEVLSERSGDMLISVLHDDNNEPRKVQYILTNDGLASALDTEQESDASATLTALLPSVERAMAMSVVESKTQLRKRGRTMGITAVVLAVVTGLGVGGYSVATTDARHRAAIAQSGYSLPTGGSGDTVTVTTISEKEMKQIPVLEGGEAIDRPRKVDLEGTFASNEACTVVPVLGGGIIAVATDGKDVLSGAQAKINTVDNHSARVCVDRHALTDFMGMSTLSTIAIQEIPR